jgi:hypothetical protein
VLHGTLALPPPQPSRQSKAAKAMTGSQRFMENSFGNELPNPCTLDGATLRNPGVSFTNSLAKDRRGASRRALSRFETL